LLEFKYDFTWKQTSSLLVDSCKESFLTQDDLHTHIRPAISFLHEKCMTGDPLSKFVSVRIWEQFHKYRGASENTAIFEEACDLLCQPFVGSWLNVNLQYDSMDIWRTSTTNAIFDQISMLGLPAELLFLKELDFKTRLSSQAEALVVYNSILPILLYYKNKIKSYGYAVNLCKACKTPFVAKNFDFELCSDYCKKNYIEPSKDELKDIISSINTEEQPYAERPDAEQPDIELPIALSVENDDDDDIDSDSEPNMSQTYDWAYYYWYNRIRKLKFAKTIDNAKTAEAVHAFEIFRKEARAKKRAVKKGTLSEATFSDWIDSKCDVIDTIMEEI